MNDALNFTYRQQSVRHRPPEKFAQFLLTANKILKKLCVIKIWSAVAASKEITRVWTASECALERKIQIDHEGIIRNQFPFRAGELSSSS